MTEYQKQWHEKNKPRKRLYMKAYREKNKERIDRDNRERYKQNPGKYSATNRAWVERNREKSRAIKQKYLDKLGLEEVRKRARLSRARRRKTDEAFRLKELRRSAQWRRENKPKMVAHSRKRKALKRNQTPSDADFKLIELFYEISQRVAECLGVKHHVDHIFPIAKGGLHHQRNLQVLPARINQQKKDKIIAFERAA